MMSGQGTLFKMMTFFGGYRSILTNRASAINYHQQNATVRSSATEKLKHLNLPDKPKKPLTGYFRFVRDHRPAILKTNPKMFQTDIAKQCAQDWRGLSEDAKEKYQEEYKAEKLVYDKKYLEYFAKLTQEQKNVIKEAAQEHITERNRRKLMKINREAGKPKAVKGPYSFFIKEKCALLQKPMIAVMQEAKEEWHTLTQQQKQKYHDLYLDDRKRYELEMDDWEEKMMKEGRTELVRQAKLVEYKPTRPIRPKKDGFK